MYLYVYKDVESFDQQMGYQSEGHNVEKIGVPHRLMKKTLQKKVAEYGS